MRLLQRKNWYGPVEISFPGSKEPFPNPDAVNQLEKRYFEPGDRGFRAFRVPGLVPDAIKKKAMTKLGKQREMAM